MNKEFKLFMEYMKRIEWIDLAKGIGIIFLIYGHIADDYLTMWIYSFHIPLFFFISGYLFNPQKSAKEFFFSKCKGLLIPYIFLGLPMILPNLKYFSLGFLLEKFIIQERMFPLWYVASLFLQLVIAYIIINAIKMKWLQSFMFFGLAFMGVLFWRNGGKSLPWNFDISLITLPFFYIGYEMKNMNTIFPIFDRGVFYFVFPIFLLINIVGCLITYHILGDPQIDLFANNFGFEPLTYITAISGIMLVIMFSCKIRSKAISYVGRHSLVFFAWQQDFGIYPGYHLLHITNNILLLIFTLLIMTILNEIIMRTKLKVLLGKF